MGSAKISIKINRKWRRRRDSNPRDGFPPAPLAGVCLRPLGHVSAAGSSSRKPRETRAFWKQTREICGACCTAPQHRTRQDRAWIYGGNPATPVPAAFHHVEAGKQAAPAAGRCRSAPSGPASARKRAPDIVAMSPSGTFEHTAARGLGFQLRRRRSSADARSMRRAAA